jgi:hypothetical protein
MISLAPRLLVMPLVLLCGEAFAQAKPDEVKLFVPAYFYPAGEGLKDGRS